MLDSSPAMRVRWNERRLACVKRVGGNSFLNDKLAHAQCSKAACMAAFLFVAYNLLAHSVSNAPRESKIMIGSRSGLRAKLSLLSTA